MSQNFNQNLSPEQEKQIIDILTNRPGFAGDTARVLSEYYYNFCYTGDTTRDALKLINFRASIYQGFDEMNPRINEDLIIRYTEGVFDNIPFIILIFFYFENYHVQDIREIIQASAEIAYKVIYKEHLKIAESRNKPPIVSDIPTSVLPEMLMRIEEEIEQQIV